MLYTEPDETTLSVKSFEALGTPASHGCVRLLVSDAKWIYDNCKEGTIITVYEGEYDPEYTMTLKPTLNTSTLRENPLPSPTAAPVYSRANWPTKYRTLSRGKTGADVYMLQMRLTELGYYHGSVTGGYYGGHDSGRQGFQKDHGLTVDGAAGKQTQGAALLRCRRTDRRAAGRNVRAWSPIRPYRPPRRRSPPNRRPPRSRPSPDARSGALYADSGFGRINDNFV